MLTLNNAYYNVREAETQAFYEMFWAELESRNLDELLERFLAILARFCKADEAHLYLLDSDAASLALRASYGTAGASVSIKCSSRMRRDLADSRSFSPANPKSPVLDPAWAHFPTCWSVPVVSHGQFTGALQFAFARPYEWLPREQELLTAAAERCMLAIEKTRLIVDLANRQDQIRRLAERMLHVEEAERRRISRELHDQTGQDLLCIRLQLEMLEQELPDGDKKSKLSGLRDLTERTILEIRRLIGALSPAVLEQLGLAAAVRQMANRFRQVHSSKIRLQMSRLGPIPKRLEVITYRLVQECLNNIAKHSFCSNVNISLSSADGKLRLCVEDDGVGFRVDEALQKQGSFGLAGIHERVALLGGHCEIDSRPAQPAGDPRGTRTQAGRKTTSKGSKTGNMTGASGTRIYVELPVSGLNEDSPVSLPAVRETVSVRI
jgi:signal transduction histidine kinase